MFDEVAFPARCRKGVGLPVSWRPVRAVAGLDLNPTRRSQSGCLVCCCCRSGCEAEVCVAPSTLTGYVVKSVDLKRPSFTANVLCDNDNGCLGVRRAFFLTVDRRRTACTVKRFS